jgi:hypothetical protein
VLFVGVDFFGFRNEVELYDWHQTEKAPTFVVYAEDDRAFKLTCPYLGLGLVTPSFRLVRLSSKNSVFLHDETMRSSLPVKEPHFTNWDLPSVMGDLPSHIQIPEPLRNF